MTYKEIILEIEQQYSKEEVLDLFMKTVNEFADIEQMQKEDIKTELDYYIKHGKDKELEKFILKNKIQEYIQAHKFNPLIIAEIYDNINLILDKLIEFYQFY